MKGAYREVISIECNKIQFFHIFINDAIYPRGQPHPWINTTSDFTLFWSTRVALSAITIWHKTVSNTFLNKRSIVIFHAINELLLITTSSVDSCYLSSYIFNSLKIYNKSSEYHTRKKNNRFYFLIIFRIYISYHILMIS